MTDALIEAFTRVRNTPYATDGAFSGAQLMSIGRGNCVAKAECLMALFRDLRVSVRRVRWLYRLPDEPPEVALLPTPSDVHTAMEAHLGGRWVLVDATHDPALSVAGLTVASWDGKSPTPPAYEAEGLLWRPGDREPEPQLPAIPEESAGRRYQAAYNRWLESFRRNGAQTPLP